MGGYSYLVLVWSATENLKFTHTYDIGLPILPIYNTNHPNFHSKFDQNYFIFWKFVRESTILETTLLFIDI